VPHPIAHQNFIITGAASGIGLATARLLKQHGAKVILWDRNSSGLAAPALELGAPSIVVDITQPDDVRAAMARSIPPGEMLGGVVHAAGILSTGLFDSLDLEEQRQMVMVNLGGTITIAYMALPYLKQSGGSLVLLASSSAFYGTPEYAAYGAAKAGVLSLAQALRLELSGSGVHIGVVSPLFVATPMLQGYNAHTHMIRSRSPFFDTLPPEAVASAIVGGIMRRQFMIFPGWRPRLLFWVSRYASMAMHMLTHMTYRQGGGV
jgi:short-subunit dehydrogenase